MASYDALLLTSGIWFLAKFFRYAFPPLFPTFQADFGLSNTLLGTAFSGMMLVYAAMQFPAGALVDRFGSVRIIAAGAAITAGAGLLLTVGGAVPIPVVGTVAALPVIIAGMVLVGAGTGAHKTVAIRLLSRVYPQRTGRALGAFDTFGTFGGVAAPAVVVALTDAAGWRVLFLGGGLLGLGLLAGFVWRVPRRLPDDGASKAIDDRDVDGDGATPGGVRRYARLFADPTFSTFVGVNALFGFAYNGAVAFMVLFLVDATGLASVTANLLFSALFVVSVVQVATGDLSDRLGERLVMAATLALAAGGLVGLLFASGPVLACGAVVAFGIGSLGFRPVRGAYLVTLVPDSVAGGSMGIVRTILMGSGAVSPAVVGYLSDVVGFVPAFALLAVSMAAAAVAAGLLSRLESGSPL
ncbi:MAG: MFS transporter [Halobacteriales archaeon]